MEYTIVFGKEINDLINIVNDYMLKGWKPVGGAHYDPHMYWYMQAMIK